MFLCFSEFVWGCIDWADTDITLFGDDDAFDKFGKKSCLVSLSHRGEFDWVIGLIVAAGYGFLEVNKWSFLITDYLMHL